MQQRSVTSLHVGEYVATRLQERGMTADQLTHATSLPQGFLTHLLTGEQILTADVAIVLRDFLEESPLALLDLQRHYCIDAREQEDARRVLAA